jgi:hypothetical protein
MSAGVGGTAVVGAGVGVVVAAGAGGVVVVAGAPVRGGVAVAEPPPTFVGSAPHAAMREPRTTKLIVFTST